MSEWEFDAPQDDPLTALRIPVTSSHPQWYYIVAFDRESEERPTEAEAAMLVSFLEQYIDYWYNDSFKAKLAQRPFDVDGDAHGVIFHKWGTDDWGYRRRTFEYGWLFSVMPPACRDKYTDGIAGPLSLSALMDRIQSHGDATPSPRWVTWKAAHPEVFGAVAASDECDTGDEVSA